MRHLPLKAGGGGKGKNNSLQNEGNDFSLFIGRELMEMMVD